MQGSFDKELYRPHRTSPGEIADLLAVVERDLRDAAVTEISIDRRFATAYNAVLQLATIAIYASGSRTRGRGHHYATISALPYILGPGTQEITDYFNSCRTRRHNVDYDRVLAVTENELAELLREAVLFKTMVLEWLGNNHPDLLR